MVVGRTRCLSWEEQSGLHLVHQENDADSPAPCAEQAAAASAVRPLPAPVSTRAEEVAQLQAYLAGLGGGAEMPEAFPSLVRRLLQERRDSCVAERGWVASAASTSSGPPGTTLPPADAPQPLTPASAAAAACEPKLSAALLKVQQLDGALAAAQQRAAAAAAAARQAEHLGQATRGSEGAANANASEASEENAACEAGGLEGAMARERRRLQCAERLQRALQEGGAAPAASEDAGAGGGIRGGLTKEQEVLLEALLAQPEEPVGPAINPYAAGLAELEALDAQLAALQAASGCGSGASPVAADPAGEAQEPAEQQDDAELDLEAAKEGYLRCARIGECLMNAFFNCMAKFTETEDKCAAERRVLTNCATAAARRGKKVNTINYHLQRISRMIRR
ncbi:hypothetical protein ABPG75_009740 [Micractinium tetrahymenae]